MPCQRLGYVLQMQARSNAGPSSDERLKAALLPPTSVKLQEMLPADVNRSGLCHCGGLQQTTDGDGSQSCAKHRVVPNTVCNVQGPESIRVITCYA